MDLLIVWKDGHMAFETWPIEISLMAFEDMFIMEHLSHIEILSVSY